jgi:hypothetical protein
LFEEAIVRDHLALPLPTLETSVVTMGPNIKPRISVRNIRFTLQALKSHSPVSAASRSRPRQRVVRAAGSVASCPLAGGVTGDAQLPPAARASVAAGSAAAPPLDGRGFGCVRGGGPARRGQQEGRSEGSKRRGCGEPAIAAAVLPAGWRRERRRCFWVKQGRSWSWALDGGP